MDDLGSFLRSRRGALSPEAAGVATYDRRRVPGLRREELAQLAGVSVAYLTRLEQGQSRNASSGVLDALAQALQLDDDARAHLHNLARPPQARGGTSAVPLGVRRLLDALADDVPACVLGPRMEIVAWNRLAHALLAGHLDLASPDGPQTRPNMARMVFLDPHTRELFADHDAKAREAVAFLRLSSGRRPDDAELATVIGELTMKSEAFAQLWATASVQEKSTGTRHFAHPHVGRFALAYQALAVPETDGQVLVSFSAEPGTPDAAALRLLARDG